MENEDRERLVRIETILEKVVAPQLQSYGPRIRKLETVAKVAGYAWVGIGAVALVFKDTAAEWLKRKILGVH